MKRKTLIKNSIFSLLICLLAFLGNKVNGQWNELGVPGISTDGGIKSIAIYGSTVYAATYSSSSLCDEVFKWNGSTWSQLGTIPTSPFTISINTIVVDVNGNVYA